MSVLLIGGKVFGPQTTESGLQRRSQPGHGELYTRRRTRS